MSARVGLVVKGNGSGCSLVEYDGSGAVVGQGQRIQLSECAGTVVASESARRPTPGEYFHGEPAVWSSPLVRSAGITLADALAGVRADAATPPDPAAQQATDDDPQARFVRLAERYRSYRVAAREHPDVWAAYRAAADLKGAQEVQT